ncbi:MAG: nucleotidyl transferase AbiEii/AbiGii toxin family protein [Syntrophales bacterium]
MNFDLNALIHDINCFDRETITARQERLKFNSLARMELFLWDLEIFLQIQMILKDNIVLKGGAAAQFYLPIEYQRTSIDIDMICATDQGAVEKALASIGGRFKSPDGLFNVRPHKPKDPKAHLPMMTYYMDVPSVCTEKELFGRKNPGVQEIKIEFHFTDDLPALQRMTSPRIFAMETRQTYQLLPLNDLLGDKLTTLGPDTIGIPIDREDEQIKQIYDIAGLIRFNWDSIDLPTVRKAFFARANAEARQRALSSNMPEIFSDMLAQMKRLSCMDFENDKRLPKLINNFQSLYVRKELNRSSAEWAVIGARIYLLLDYLRQNMDAKQPLDRLLQCERDLEFDSLKGADRGQIIRRFRDEFSKDFEKYSDYPAKVLKGKNPVRLMWAVVRPDNLGEIISWIDNFARGTGEHDKHHPNIMTSGADG